jgi:hypothetical protein
MEEPPTLEYARPGVLKTWPFRGLALGMTAALVLQTLFLPCMCSMGAVKMYVGLGLDLLIGTRMLIAWYRHETNRDWIFYLVLALTSVFWIPLAVGDW